MQAEYQRRNAAVLPPWISQIVGVFADSEFFAGFLPVARKPHVLRVCGNLATNFYVKSPRIRDSKGT